MSLSFGLNPWILIPALLTAAALAYWLYRRTTPRISQSRRVILGLLRFLALFLVLLLLFDPILRLIDREEQRPVVAVLVDDSQSLLLTSSTDSTRESVQSRLSDLLDRLPSAVRDAELRFYGFSESLSNVRGAGFQQDSFLFAGNRTNIAGALEEVREELRDEHLSAALLVSDGRYNTGRNPLYTAERFPVPIYTAVLGDTARHRDVQVRRVVTNDIAYIDTELPVQVGLRTEDMGGEDAVVSIARGGDVLSSQNITLPDGSSEVTIDLSVTPNEEGLHRYTVSVSRLAGEVTHRNNQEAVTVRVLRSRRSILLIGGAPGPDVSAVRQELSSGPTFDVTSYVLRSAGSFYEGTLPADLTDFDLVVLVGYPSVAATDDITNRIIAAAEDGTPLFLLLTQGTAIDALTDGLSDVLPVSAERVRSGFIEAIAVPTAEGLSHPIFNIPESDADSWRRLPPLYYSQTRWQSSPDASILARTAVRGVDLDDPLLVIRRRSQNRTAALLGAGMWRWRNVPEDLTDVEHLWPSLFSNVVEWLTAREDDRPVRVEPTRDLFGGGENVELAGQVYDESLNPISDATVEVQIRAPDGTVSPYVMNAIGNGRYTLDAGSLPEGTYSYEASATEEELELGGDEGSFAVGGLTLEFKETSADATLMRQIAQRSGGIFLEDGSVDPFGSTLNASGALAPVTVEEASELELRRQYVFLALIVVLLSIEWFIRKRSGMV